MKTFTGTVLSTKMEKTIVVQVTRMWMHPKYKKTVKRTRKYMVHDEKNVAQEHDTVVFQESRPVSKNKRFSLVRVVEDAGTAKGA